MNTKVLAFLALSLCLCAGVRAASLSTTDGVAYKNITTQRVDPDGLYIEYTLPGGGLGMTKVKFSRLSPEQQKQFGYDFAKAHDYEAQVAKANEEFRQESLRDEQLAQAARRAREERDARAINYNMAPPVQMSADQSPPPEAPPYGYGYDWSYGGGVGIVGRPNIGRVPPARRDYAPIVRPIPFPTLNTPIQTPPKNVGRVAISPVRPIPH